MVLIRQPNRLHLARQAYNEKTLHIDCLISYQFIAEKRGWKLPLFNKKKAFLEKMLESDKNLEDIITQTGCDVYVPIHLKEQ